MHKIPPNRYHNARNSCRNQLNADYLALDKLLAPNHFLRKIKKCVDFSFVKNLTESYYCPNNGRPSIPPELYFKIILIGYLNGINSSRRLVQEIKYNISYRWFCGLTLTDAIPNHASLSRIKKRYTVTLFEEFFIAILKQCQKAGLLDSYGVMTDSTLFQANASLNSMRPVIENAPMNLRPTKDGIVEKQWNISNKTHSSISDPDATLAYKLGSQNGLKYKAHVCSDTKSRVIAAIKVTTGAVHDSQPYLELIDDLKDKLGLPIDEVIADRAYGSEEILASLKAAGIQTFIPLFTTRSGVNKYSQFQDLNFDNENTYICSANIAFKIGQVNSQGFITYRTSIKDCRNCSLKDSCSTAGKRPRNSHSGQTYSWRNFPTSQT